MYCGDEGEATGEDLELERYGLTEGQNSGSGESDTEEALYQQVHYNIDNDDNIQSTTEESTKSNIGMKEDPLTTSRDSPTANRGNEEKGEMYINTADVLVASDGDDDDDGYNWKRVGRDSKYKTNLRTKTKHVVTNVRSSRKTKAAVIVKDDSESDIICLDVETKNQESKKRETVTKEEERKSRKRSWRKTSDDDQTKITKINRNSWSSARQGSEAQAISSRTSKVVVIVEDSSSSSVVVLDSERSEEDVSQPKRRPGKDSGEFFLDSKGMALVDVQRDKASAELGWKAERMKTKAMLKEGVEIINLSSGEEDCMVIESCSEEEGLHVHFDENGDEISPETNNSGIRKGKRKGGESTTSGRYFVQSRQKHIRCHNCNEMGHLKVECPKPLHIPACILCGTRGHTDRSCPDALCFNCSLPGHQSKSCPIKRHIRYANCTRCQMPGHLRKMCPDIWRQYHLTTEHGPIIKPTNQHQRTKQKDVYCSNCSKKGHRYYDCRLARFDEFVMFTYDKVCLYDKKHIGKMVYPAENKNAEYRKLLRERIDKVPSSMTKKDWTSITKDNSQPRSKKRKLPEEEQREDKFICEREKASVGKEQKQSGKNKIPNPVQTFVRTRLFGGKKGRSWAQQDEPVMIPSKRQQKETEAVSEGGCEKLTKAQKGRSWAQLDEPVMIPSKRQQKDTEAVSEGGCEKLTKAQKGRSWAQLDEPVMIPSKRQQKDTEAVSEGGCEKLTKAQKGRSWAQLDEPVMIPSKRQQKDTEAVSEGGCEKLTKAQKGRSWAQLDEPVMIPSKRQQKDTEAVSEGGCEKLTKAQKGRSWAQLDEPVMIPSKRQQKDTEAVSEGGCEKLTKAQKGRSWAQLDEPVMIPSKRQQKDTEAVSEGGCEKLTKAQKKAQRKALKAQQKQEAKSKRMGNPENVGQDLAEARRIKHSAVLAMNAVKREIKAALMKKKEKAEPVPEPVTVGMTKQQKKAVKRKIRLKERKEVRLALEEKMKSDVEVRKVDRVFKEARKLCREAKKMKREVDGKARRAQFVPAERQHSVWEDPAYAMSQRGFNLDNRLLEGTHHQDNRWTIPQAGPWDEAFPRSYVSNTNDPTFTNGPYSNSPAFNDGMYNSNTNFMESPFDNCRTLTVTCPKGKKKRRRGKRRKKQGVQGGL